MDGAECAESCLGSFVGICPASIVVSKGGLAQGACASLGFTKADGTLSQKAGPCGTITFDKYVKPATALAFGKALA